MLKPASMEKIAVVGLRDDRQKVVSILYDLGAMQIEPLSKSSLSYLRSELEADETRTVSQELLRVRALKAAIPPTTVQEKRRFGSFAEVMQVSRSIKIDEEVSRLKQAQDKLSLRLDELTSRIELVTNLAFIKGDLTILDLESATSFFGLIPARSYQQLLTSLAQIEGVVPYSSGTDPIHAVLIVPKEDLEKFGSIVQKGDFKLQPIPPMKGKPSDVLPALNEEKRLRASELETTNSQLRSLSQKHYGMLTMVEEQLSIEARKLEILNNFGFTDSTFALEGWVPSQRLPGLQEVLTRHAGSTSFFAIEKDSRPPTLMENPKRLRFFESFIRFYSLPQSDELDPTLVFAFTFPIFFGLMLGDVGYGLVILGISIWILRRLKHRGKTIVPRQIRSFAKNIFRPAQFRKLAMAMIPGSIIGIVFGFIFNEYFGFGFNQYLFSYLNTNLHVGLPSSGAFLDPTSSRGLKILLELSGYIGLFEVSLGLGFGMLDGYWAHETKHILGKLGWLFTAWGIALIGLTILHHGTIVPSSNPLGGVYIGLVVAGLGFIGYGEGPQSLVELPSIVSHIVSFTRLVGILLASIILASVIDSVFVGAVAGGVIVAILGVVILVGGQLFNIIISLFEPGIQGARLLFVETFSKFFHGGGRPFLPFKGRRTYTIAEIEHLEPTT